jgi:hypothetical protein
LTDDSTQKVGCGRSTDRTTYQKKQAVVELRVLRAPERSEWGDRTITPCSSDPPGKTANPSSLGPSGAGRFTPGHNPNLWSELRYFNN